MSDIEIYVSRCCGGVFSPGYGPDNIVEAEADRLVDVGPLNEGEQRSKNRRALRIDPRVADLYDAVRAGDCPMCGESCPPMDEVEA